MWPFNHDRVTKRLNTIDLGDDLADVEMLEAIEKAFGFEIFPKEAERLVTVGDLYDLVDEKVRKAQSVDPVWALVEMIVRFHSGSKDPIDRETTFFSKCASKRE